MPPLIVRSAIALSALLLITGCQSEEEQRAAHAERADEYYEAEQWKEAKIEFLNLLQLDPDNGEANYKLAEVQRRLGQYADALWRYRESVRLDPEQALWRTRFGALLFAARRLDDAREQADEALARAPDDPEALLLRAQIHGADQEPERMLESLDAVLGLTEGAEEDLGKSLRSASFTLKSQLHWQRQEFEKAEASLRAFAEFQNQPGPHLLLAVFLVDRERPDEALAEYRAAINTAEDEPSRLRSQFAMAAFLVNRKEFDDAEQILIEARDKSPDREEPLIQLARFYHMRGRPDDAAKTLEEAAQRRPEEANPLLVLADFHRQVGDKEKALDAVDRALALEPELERARLARAEFLMDERAVRPELTEEARNIVTAVLEENPDSVMGLFTQAKFDLIDGKNEEGANRLRRVVQESPSSSAHMMLAGAYRGMGQSDLARSELIAAIQLEDSNQQARRMLVQLYLEAGNYALAIQESEAALRRNPSDGPVALFRARALAASGEKEKALAALKGISFPSGETGEAVTRLRLAASGIYLQLGAGEQAIKLAEEVLEADPANPQALRLWTAQKSLGGEAKAGVARVNKALERAPDDPELYDLRAALRLAAGAPEAEQAQLRKNVMADLETSIEKGPKRAAPHVMLARLHLISKDVDKADASLRKAIEVDPSNTVAYVQRAEMLERTGKKREAQQVYEALLQRAPDHAGAKNNLAWLLASNEPVSAEALDRAQDLAQDAKEAHPDSAAIADTLGWVMLQKRIPRAAIALFREAVGNAANSHMRATARYHLALAYEQTGEAQKAIAELEIAIGEDESFPDRSEAEAALERLKTG